MRIAVVGGGVSGLVSAWRLSEDHQVTVFEASTQAGGHARTVRVAEDAREFDIDIGFIVFNEENYPGFCALLDDLNVAWQESEMSFSVRCDRTSLEYRGSSFDTLFSQRRNLVRPAFHRLLADLWRFFREAPALLRHPTDSRTLRQYLDDEGYSTPFVEQHVLPLASALWSSGLEAAGDLPARWFVSFLHHHRMLQVRGRPTWRTIDGGSHRYVNAMVDRLGTRLRLSHPVRSVERRNGGDAVAVHLHSGESMEFDHVVMAVHSDQALSLLQEPTTLERELLGRIPYRANEVVLHTDESVLPRRTRAWASWNYHIPKERGDTVLVTYLMNRLQRLRSNRTYCVTLNPGNLVDEAQVIHRTVMHHPIFTLDAEDAQRRRDELLCHRGISYCGAYWGFGFHEDGVQSAHAVCDALGVLV